MSVETFNRGKVLRVLIPKVIAADSIISIEDCQKTERDEGCEMCLAKYTCQLYREKKPKIAQAA